MGIIQQCWLYTGTLTRGYGQLSIDGEKFYTHRLAYEIIIGPIPEGLHIDHLCRVPACYNPFHMEPVTQAENNRRGFHWKTVNTHCVRGHPWDEENTRWYEGQRICRACDRLRGSGKNRRRLGGIT